MKTKTILSQVMAMAAHGARLATLLLAAVAAGRAWAIVADDVWELESGLPTSGKQEGANGNYTLTAAGDSTLGATIDLSGVSSLANVSVLVKYTGLSAQSSGYYTLVSVQAAASASSSNVIGWRNSAANALTATGYYVASSLNAYRFDTYSDSNYTYSEGTVPELPESGYFLFTHDISASAYSGTYGTALYAASSLSSLAGGVNRQLKWARDTNSARCITTLSVGGPVEVSSTEAAAVSAWPNVTIEKVALFVGQTLTPSDVASYQFPSEQDYAATIMTDTDWDDIVWAKDWVASSDATITVEGDATLTIPDTASIGTLNLSIANGVTLTLANSGTISAIAATGGTLQFSDGATTPCPISGSSAISVADSESLTIGAAVTTSGGFTIGDGAVLTAPYANISASTGAFTGGTTAKIVMALSLSTTDIRSYSNFNSLWKFNDSSYWTGTVELSGNVGLIRLTEFGNTSSTVSMNGLTSYIETYTASTTSSHNIGTLNIASGGWTLAGSYSSGVFVFPAALTGTGTLQTGSASSSSGVQNSNTLRGGSTVFLTGDLSGFGGTLRVNSGSDSGSYARIIILRTESATDDPRSYSAYTGYGLSTYKDQTLTIAHGNSVTIAAGQTFASRNGYVIDGELTLNGSIIKWTGTNGVLVGGSGTVTTPTPSGTNWAPFTTASGWTGTVVVPSFTLTSGTQASIKFNSIGNSDSTVVFKGNGASGQFWPVEYNATINPIVQLDGSMYISNGTSTSGQKGTFSRLSGGGNLLIYTYNYCVDVLTNFTGTVGANNANILSINTIALAEDAAPAVGDRLVSISQTVTNLDGVDDTVVTIGGEETAIKLEKLYTGTATAGLYVAGVATDGTTSYATVGDAVEAAGETEGTISVSASTENETLTVDGDITLTLADEVTLTVASLSGDGTLTVNVADGYSTGATIVIPKGATIGNIALGDGVTLYVDGAIASGDTLFTLTGDSATAFETVSCVYGTIHVTDTDGVITAGRTYYWAGTSTSETDATRTSKAEFWASDAEKTVTGESSPFILDTAVFDLAGGWAKVDADLECNIEIKANMVLYSDASSASAWTLGCSTVAATLTIDEGAVLELRPINNSVKFNVYSTLLGTGTLRCNSADQSTQYCGVDFYGSTADFAGTVDMLLTKGTQYSRIQNSAAMDNSLSRWNISTNGTYTSYTNGKYTPFLVAGTYKFGVLNGYLSNNSACDYALTFEIGEEVDEDSTIYSVWSSTTASKAVVWKADSATLTLGGTTAMTSLDIANTGSAYIANEASVPSSGITFSANGYLTIDSGNASAAATIVGAIAAPDSAAVGFDVSAEAAADLSSAESFALADGVSFNKKGSGRLTITGAFTSIGTVDVAGSGALVLVVAGDDSLESAIGYTCAAGTQCTVSDDFKTYTFTPVAPMVKINDGEVLYNTITKALDVASSGDTITLTGDSPSTETVVLTKNVTVVCGTYQHGTITTSAEYAAPAETDGTYTLGSAAATIYTWASGNSGEWSDTANWTYGESVAATRVPESVDTVIMTDGTVTIDGSVQAAQLSVSGKVLVSPAQDGASATLAVSGAMYIGTTAGTSSAAGPSATLTLDGMTTTVGGEMLVGKDYADATLTVSGGSLTVTASKDAVIGLGLYAEGVGGTGVLNITDGANVTYYSDSACFCVAGNSSNNGKSSTHGILTVENGTATLGKFRAAVGPSGNTAVITIGGSDESASVTVSEMLVSRTNSSTENTNRATFSLGKNGSFSSNGKAEVFGPVAFVYDEDSVTTDTAPFAVNGTLQIQSSFADIEVSAPSSLSAGTYNLASWNSKSVLSGVTEPSPVLADDAARVNDYTLSLTSTALTLTVTLAGVEVEVDDGATVTVPTTWLETYDLTSATASDLTAGRSEGNGYSYFACYALGLDPTDADSVPLATITSDSDGNFVVGLTGCGTIPDNVSITLSLVSTTDIDEEFDAYDSATTSGSGIDTTFTITPSTVSSVEFFKVKITIGSAE